jgi:RNA polymerase sigma-70 factor (ECF subfamily)
MAVVTPTSLNGPQPSDEQLLSDCRAGKASALDTLFQRYRHVAYRVAFRLLGNEADALDAVQDGFVKVLLHLERFEGRSSFKTWLLRVVSNASPDFGRQRRRREQLSKDELQVDAERESVQDEDSPCREIECRETRGLLNQALLELPEAQRRTFVLHVDGELSYREIAAVLRISVGTVMSRLFYARRKLRALLSERVTA